jgi:hypothetical protein
MKYSAVSLAPPEPRALRLHARTSSPPKPGASLSTFILNLLLLAGERLVMGLPFASSAARLHDMSLQGCAIFLWSIMSMKVHFNLHREPLTSAVAWFLPPHCLHIGSWRGQCDLPRRYAIACFLLQAKDRHNGNILIDVAGHLVHIDFGFILEISPGGNMRFESAAFKLSHEMTLLVDPGGGRNSREFRQFENLCVRGFLAVGRLPRTSEH